MTAAVLAADVGRTTCRVARYDGGARVAEARRACGASLSDRDGTARLRGVVGAALAQLPQQPAAPQVSAAVLGVTGAAQCPAAAQALAAALADDLGAPVSVVGDVTAAHAGAFAGGPGVLTVAGTGAVALGVGADGTAVLVDGWGPLLGDAGSALDVGRAGLAAALRARDGRGGGSPALAAAASARFGDLAGLPGRVQGDASPFRLLASFAADVATAARGGDAVATAIFAHAVEQLVETTLAAVRGVGDRAGTVAVAFAGGMFDVEDLVAVPVRTTLSGVEGVEVRAAAGDALDGAHLLAAGAGVASAAADAGVPAAAAGAPAAGAHAPAVAGRTARHGQLPAPGSAVACHALQWAHPRAGATAGARGGAATGAVIGDTTEET